MFHYSNSYLIPNARVQAWCCKTNLPSNTAFRGFGGPQGLFVGEHIVRDVAHALGKSEIEIAEMNLFKDGDSTHFNQVMENCTIQRYFF